ncbi:MAG: class I SAM-dependent methyltransferase, partial [Pseudomonadota bacterium]
DSHFDHVLSWNVIYHGDKDVLLRTITEIRRILKPGRHVMGTMPSNRHLPHEHAKHPSREIGRNTSVYDAPGTDKVHPHYFCTAAYLLALFTGLDCLSLKNRNTTNPGHGIGT